MFIVYVLTVVVPFLLAVWAFFGSPLPGDKRRAALKAAAQAPDRIAALEAEVLDPADAVIKRIDAELLAEEEAQHPERFLSPRERIFVDEDLAAALAHGKWTSRPLTEPENVSPGIALRELAPSPVPLPDCSFCGWSIDSTFSGLTTVYHRSAPCAEHGGAGEPDDNLTYAEASRRFDAAIGRVASIPPMILGGPSSLHAGNSLKITPFRAPRFPDPSRIERW